MRNELSGWKPYDIQFLCIGDIFKFKQVKEDFTYMGNYTYESVEYFLYEGKGIPYIAVFDKIKDELIYVKKQCL